MFSVLIKMHWFTCCKIKKETFRHEKWKSWVGCVGGGIDSVESIPEPLFVNLYGAQESIPRSRFRQAGNQFLSSLKGLQIRALGSLKVYKFGLAE
jgi:hypothetical protein